MLEVKKSPLSALSARAMSVWCSTIVLLYLEVVPQDEAELILMMSGGTIFTLLCQFLDHHNYFSFDPITLAWEQIKATGDIPKVRHNHSGVLFEGSLYIYGGQTDGDGYLGDLVKLDLTTHTWQTVWKDELGA